MEILKGLLIGLICVLVAVNLEVLLVFIASVLGLKRVFNRFSTLVEFAVAILTFLSVIFVFFAVHYMFGLFGISHRWIVLVIFFIFDFNNSFLDIVKIEAGRAIKNFMIYENEIYAIFVGRLLGFILGFTLLFLRMV